jgi:transcriptional regulator with XRE-family HTH domain
MTVDVTEIRTTGRRVRQFRKAAGLTKAALATKANVARSTIQALESADTTGYNPHVSTLSFVAEALGVKVGEIVNRGHVIPL